MTRGVRVTAASGSAELLTHDPRDPMTRGVRVSAASDGGAEWLTHDPRDP